MKHWLIKSEPETFSIDDLAKVKREPWSGVRNYQARNFMWKEMRIGDPALFYHSNAKPPGIVGLARVVGEPYPDPTQWDPGSEYFDPKSSEDNPRWWLVDFAFEKKFAEMIPLEKLRGIKALADMVILQKGTRLSITPVATKHFNAVMKLAR
jgi:predicted RNA-binding protein with PUA-like domain